MKTRYKPTTRNNVSAFLSLPTEIRYDIYRLVLTAPLLRLQETKKERERPNATLYGTVRLITQAKASTQFPATSVECSKELLRVCRQIYDEAFPFFYGHVTLSIEKPLDFANNFLRHLDSTKASQIRKLRFKIGPVVPPFWEAVDHLSSFKFNHILMLFKFYPELRNLDSVVMEVVDDSRIFPFDTPDLVAYRTPMEVTPDELSSTTEPNWSCNGIRALHRTTIKLHSGDLEGFRIFRSLATVVHERQNRRTVASVYSITLRRLVRSNDEAPISLRP